MKKLTQYMDLEYLSSESTYLQKQFQQGKIAMGNLWFRQAASMDNQNESTVVGKMKMSVIPSIKKKERPTSTLWWNGIVITKNIRDREAEAVFRVAIKGMDREMVQSNNDVAIWLINRYRPSRLSKEAIKTIKKKIPPYPSSSAMSLAHTSLENIIPDYLTECSSDQQTLSKIERITKFPLRKKD